MDDLLHLLGALRLARGAQVRLDRRDAFGLQQQLAREKDGGQAGRDGADEPGEPDAACGKKV